MSNNYCSIDDEDIIHINKLIDWLYNEMLCGGGDGDAFWYSEFYNIEEILILVQNYNDNLKYKMSIDFNKENQTIFWRENQQCITITNNKELYDTCPTWMQAVLKY